MKTIVLNPSWLDVLPILLTVLENGSAKGRQEAIEELKRMAQAADAYNVTQVA